MPLMMGWFATQMPCRCRHLLGSDQHRHHDPALVIKIQLGARRRWQVDAEIESFGKPLRKRFTRAEQARLSRMKWTSRCWRSSRVSGIGLSCQSQAGEPGGGEGTQPQELVRTWLGIGDLADDDATESGDPEPESQGLQRGRRRTGLAWAGVSAGLIQRMGLEATVTEKESEGVTLLEVEEKPSAFSSVAMEKLDAIHLVNLSANKRAHLSGDGCGPVVDVAGYRRRGRTSRSWHTRLQAGPEDGKDQARNPSPLNVAWFTCR